MTRVQEPDLDEGWSAPRTSTRDRAGRRRPLLIGAAAVVVAGALVIWLVAFSPMLGVRTVTVHGTHAVPAQAVLKAADVHHGTPLLRLDTGAIVRRVEQVPGIGSATVRTSYPSTVVITVTERTAIGVVRSGTGYALVDADGAQYRTVSTRPANLPLFVLPAGAGALRAARAVATVAAALTPQLRARVRSIQALSPGAITLQLHAGRLVHWGGAAQSAEKARILPVLLRHHPSVVDVEDPAQPFTR